MKSRDLRHMVFRTLARTTDHLPSLTRAKHEPAITTCMGLLLGASIVAACSFLEGTITLPDDGRGLANHYGIWAIFVGSPALVLIASATYSKFVQTAQALNSYTIGAELPQELKRIVDENIASLQMNRRTRLAFLLFVVIGWYLWLINVLQTLYPYDSYGNDVFDAYPHILGFCAFKIYLGFLWVMVYPALAYVSLHIFISMIVILRYMSQNKLFKLDYFHEDDCGGVSVFGNINLLLLLMTFTVFVTELTIKLTHKGNYLSIWSSLLISFALMLFQSVVGVYHIHTFVRQKKREVLAVVNRFLNQSLLKAGYSRAFPEDLLAVRNHITHIRSFPYAKGVRLLVNVLRLSPAAVGLVHIVQRL